MEAQNKDFGAGLQMYWLSVEQAVVYIVDFINSVV